MRGTWLDAPYAHECDIDEAMDRTAWIERSLAAMRGGVFHAAVPHPDSRAAPARWRAIWSYAVAHDLLRREVSDAAARSCVGRFAAIAKRRELMDLIAYCEARRLRDYLAVAASSAPVSLRDVFQNVALPDAKREARALTCATALYAKLHAKLVDAGGAPPDPATTDARDGGTVAAMNNLVRALIDRGRTDEAGDLLAAIRSIIGARMPADEVAWSAATASLAMDEYFFRCHAASWAWATKTHAAGIADARRGVVLEDFLDEKSLAGKLQPQVFGSSAAWGLMSCLAETKKHEHAAEFFAAMVGDRARLHRRLAARANLEIALVAGFYATFKEKPIDPTAVGALLEAAIGAVARPTQGLLAHWYAFVCCALDCVADAERFIRLAASLGVDAHAIVAEDEWKPLIAKYDLAAREPWRSWLS